jgi:hypothetical protein
MASIKPYPQRKNSRIRYTLHLPRKSPIERVKYSKTQAESRVMVQRLGEVESAIRTGLARLEAIREWIDRKWITEDEVDLCFEGFAETQERKRA